MLVQPVIKAISQGNGNGVAKFWPPVALKPLNRFWWNLKHITTSWAWPHMQTLGHCNNMIHIDWQHHIHQYGQSITIMLWLQVWKSDLFPLFHKIRGPTVKDGSFSCQCLAMAVPKLNINNSVIWPMMAEIATIVEKTAKPSGAKAAPILAMYY